MDLVDPGGQWHRRRALGLGNHVVEIVADGYGVSLARGFLFNPIIRVHTAVAQNVPVFRILCQMIRVRICARQEKRQLVHLVEIDLFAGALEADDPAINRVNILSVAGKADFPFL